MSVSVLSKALLLAFALVARPAMAGNSIFDDSLEWNNPEEYTVSDWGPISDGISIRVISPCDIAFGTPLQLVLERRIYPEYLRPVTARWSINPEAMQFQLDIYDSEDCPGECTMRYVFGKVDFSSDLRTWANFNNSEAQRLLVNFVPEVILPKWGPMGMQYDDAPSFPIVPGSHTYRLKLIVTDSAPNVWNGTAETFLRVVTRSELVVRKRLTIIVPHAIEMIDSSTAHFGTKEWDTLSFFPQITHQVWSIFRLKNVTRGQLVCERGDTDRFVYSSSWPIRLDAGKQDNSPSYEDLVLLRLEESNGRPPHMGSTGGPVLWSRSYVLPNDRQNGENPDSTKH
jgi:hypothetical protein